MICGNFNVIIVNIVIIWTSWGGVAKMQFAVGNCRSYIDDHHSLYCFIAVPCDANWIDPAELIDQKQCAWFGTLYFWCRWYWRRFGRMIIVFAHTTRLLVVIHPICVAAPARPAHRRRCCWDLIINTCGIKHLFGAAKEKYTKQHSPPLFAFWLRLEDRYLIITLHTCERHK